MFRLVYIIAAALAAALSGAPRVASAHTAVGASPVYPGGPTVHARGAHRSLNNRLRKAQHRSPIQHGAGEHALVGMSQG